ncbi:MAG: hypothetical protein AB4042_01305 [Leptolyngbyaceae cyanobacterium]
MMYRFITLGSLLFIGHWTSSAQAQTTRSIPSSYARGEHPQPVTIDLYRGHGISLNFRATGETIQRAWLDDPSQTTLDFDDVRCRNALEPGMCAATVIHLRRIEPLSFENLPATATTVLTVLTQQNLYQFYLAFPTGGLPEYTALNIQPELALAAATPNHAEVVGRGLQIAQNQGLIVEGDRLWTRIQTFLVLLRSDISPSDAATQVGISEALVLRLMEIGQQSPSTAWVEGT